MIPRKRKRQRMNVRPPERVRSPAHLAWVREHFCAASFMSLGYIVVGGLCHGRIEAHHAELPGEGAMGIKPGDDRCVPLCGKHHEEGHRIGWKSFEEKYRINLGEVAKALWKQSPARQAWERKQKERT